MYLLDIRNTPFGHPELLDPLRKLRKPWRWSRMQPIKAILDCSNFDNAWLVWEIQSFKTYLLDIRNIPDCHPELLDPIGNLRKPLSWFKRLTIKAILDCSNFDDAWVSLKIQSFKTYLLHLRNIPDCHPELLDPLRKLRKPLSWSKRLTIKAVASLLQFW